MDQEARRHWLNIYRQRARQVRSDLQNLHVPLNDPLAAQVEQRLQTLLEVYDAAIDELQKADESPDR
ncbi:MAG: hypothetical protein ACXWZY_08215 [Gaiellaceae bacterium]